MRDKYPGGWTGGDLCEFFGVPMEHVYSMEVRGYLPPRKFVKSRGNVWPYDAITALLAKHVRLADSIVKTNSFYVPDEEDAEIKRVRVKGRFG